MLVRAARSSASTLSCRRSRCWMITKAMPVSEGRWVKSSLMASRPPADAPMPTTGQAEPEDVSKSAASAASVEPKSSERGHSACESCSNESSELIQPPARARFRTALFYALHGLKPSMRGWGGRQLNRMLKPNSASGPLVYSVYEIRGSTVPGRNASCRRYPLDRIGSEGRGERLDRVVAAQRDRAAHLSGSRSPARRLKLAGHFREQQPGSVRRVGIHSPGRRTGKVVSLYRLVQDGRGTL